MSTQLFKHLGQTEMSNAGAVLAGGRVYPQRNDTSAPANTYLDSAGSTLNSFEDDADTLGPYIELDANGRYPESVFLADTASYPAGYKFVVRDANKVVQYTLSDVPAAAVAFTGGQFAAELMNWIQVTSSPLNLTAADAGKCYELDTTSVAITVNLPTAAATGNGKGFTFKKQSANNTVTIARAGTDTIDGVTSKIMYGNDKLTKLNSNGAGWNVAEIYEPLLESVDRKSGSFGGVLFLSAPASGHTLTGNVAIDVEGNRLRIFEGLSTFRGLGFDLTTAAGGAASVGFHSGIAATQPQMETASSFAAIPVVPSTMHFHPAMAKVWAYITITAGTPSLAAAHNVASITDGGVGIYGITLATAFSSALWAEAGQAFAGVAVIAYTNATKTASAIQISVKDTGNNFVDPAAVALVGFGDQ